jgi:hypothetical protein
MTDDDDIEQWSEEARDRFIDATAALQAALASHISTLSAARNEGDLPAILAANDALDHAATVYADAQFDLTGTFPAFEDLEDDDEEDDEIVGNKAEEDVPASSVMVLTRVVYGLRRERDVIEAGRRAAARTHDPVDIGVVDLAHALHEIAHDGGWAALDSVDGLQLLKRSTWIATAPTPPQHALDDPFAEPFVLDDGAELRYRVDDVR